MVYFIILIVLNYFGLSYQKLDASVEEHVSSHRILATMTIMVDKARLTPTASNLVLALLAL